MEWVITSPKEFSVWAKDFAASNPNVSPEVLRRIIQNKENAQIGHAIANPSCPMDLVESALLSGRDTFVEIKAAENPNCPPELIARVLARGKDDGVSRVIVTHPNCPNKAKVDWLRAIGHIETENPEKHVVEPVRADPDIDTLQNLVGRSQTWHKTAAQKGVSSKGYDFKRLMDPNCPPEILAKVLSYHRAYKFTDDNKRAIAAASNPNCPVEVLREIALSGSNGEIVMRAVLNPSCPVDALREIVANGHKHLRMQAWALRNPRCPPDVLGDILFKDNGVWLSQSAAKNPACPPDALEFVLRKYQDPATRRDNYELDAMLETILRNPSTPPKARVNFLRASGSIEQEDHTRHVMDPPKIQSDPDLGDLEKLISEGSAEWLAIVTAGQTDPNQE